MSIEGDARAGPIAPSEKAFPYLRLKLFGEANSPKCLAAMTHRSTLHSSPEIVFDYSPVFVKEE